MEYLSIAQMSEKWKLSKRRIQVLCAEGRINGAKKIGSFWVIPEDAVKPQDARIKSGKYIMKNKQRVTDKTIQYYNQNAKQFVENTVGVDFRQTQMKFLKQLSKGALILDFGCGSGRDTKFFLENDYKVEAIDGSKELCREATKYTGITVRHMFFEELNEQEKYDGIWACASILHLEKEKLLKVFRKMIIALKSEGIIYTSFKYGEFSGERNGRYFTDFTPDSFEEFIKSEQDIKIKEYWITNDVRPGRGDEKWLNLILQKKSK